MMRVAIAGAGGYGQVLREYLKDDGDLEVVGWLDDDPKLTGTKVRGLPVLGQTENLETLRSAGVTGLLGSIGNNAARIRVLRNAKEGAFSLPQFLHPNARIGSGVRLGRGVLLMDGVCTMPFVDIGDFSILSMAANVAHHTTLGEGVFVSTGTNIGAGLRICEGSFIGIGATVMTGVKRIGAWSVVGAGAVVIDDVEPNTVVAGVPARVISRREEGWQND